ncbi:MAG: hypothetical protein AB8E82_07280 [Aureispira sp.]
MFRFLLLWFFLIGCNHTTFAQDYSNHIDRMLDSYYDKNQLE